MGRDKEQSVGTPPELAAPVYEHFNGPPDLDPYGMKGQTFRARTILLLAKHGRARMPFVRGDANDYHWRGSVYGNPAFDALEAAFENALDFSSCGDAEVILLVPFRCHRAYWQLAWRAQAICYLARPVAFLGYEHGFPMACVFLYFGRRAARFERIFASYGRVDRLTPFGENRKLRGMTTTQEIVEAHQIAAMRDLFRAFPTMSIGSIFEEAGWTPPLAADDDDPDGEMANILLDTPIEQLFGGPGSDPRPKLALAPQPLPRKRKLGKKKAAPPRTAKPKAKAKAKPKTKPAGKVTAARGPAVDARQWTVEKFCAKRKSGDSFSTEDYATFGSFSGQTARRRLHESGLVTKEGDKRGAKWVVV